MRVSDICKKTSQSTMCLPRDERVTDFPLFWLFLDDFFPRPDMMFGFLKVVFQRLGCAKSPLLCFEQRQHFWSRSAQKKIWMPKIQKNGFWRFLSGSISLSFSTAARTNESY